MGKKLGKVFASSGWQKFIEEWAETYTPPPAKTPTLKRLPDRRPPRKIVPTVNHVGPRPRRQFDHRGRAKY